MSHHFATTFQVLDNQLRTVESTTSSSPVSTESTRHVITTSTSSDKHAVVDCPRLNFRFKPLIPSLYLAFLVFFNCFIPILLYYPLQELTGISDKELIGIASAALGASSCIDAPFRLWKLVKRRDKYAPERNTKWWHLDFSMWYYTWSMFW